MARNLNLSYTYNTTKHYNVLKNQNKLKINSTHKMMTLDITNFPYIPNNEVINLYY
jgi:hypothetical protein